MLPTTISPADTTRFNPQLELMKKPQSKDMRELTAEQSLNSESAIICQLVSDHILDQSQAASLNADQRQSFEHPLIIALLKCETHQIDQLDAALEADDAGVEDGGNQQLSVDHADESFEMHVDNGNRLTAGHVLRFNEVQRETFTTPEICGLIAADVLSVELAMQLDHAQLKTFKDPIIRALIVNGTITAEQATQFSDEQRETFATPAIADLLAGGHLTVAQVKEFRPFLKLFFSDPTIVARLTSNEYNASGLIHQVNTRHDRSGPEPEKAACTLIAKGVLTASAFAAFGYAERALFNNSTTRTLIRDQILTIEQAHDLLTFRLTRERFGSESALNAQNHFYMFDNATFTDLITNNSLSFERVMKFDRFETFAFSNPRILRLLAAKIITVDQLLNLNTTQRLAFGKPGFVELVEQRKISMDQVMQLELHHEKNLGLFNEKFICQLIASDRLQLGEVLQFSHTGQRDTFADAGIRSLVSDRYLTVDQALNFSSDQLRTFCMSSVQDLIKDPTITIAQARQIGQFQRDALKDDRVVQQLRSNELTFDQFMLRYQAPGKTVRMSGITD